MSRLILGIFALCVLGIYASSDILEQRCGTNEELIPCGKDCEFKCTDSVIKPCDGDIATCPLQCRCKDGYARYDVTGQCVHGCPRV